MKCYYAINSQMSYFNLNSFSFEIEKKSYSADKLKRASISGVITVKTNYVVSFECCTVTSKPINRQETQIKYRDGFPNKTQCRTITTSRSNDNFFQKVSSKEKINVK